MSRLILSRRKLLLATPMLALPHRRAEARIPGMLGFGGRPVSGGGYTGPVDAVSGATVAYSLRAVSAAAAAAAGPCIDIWRASDSQISTIHLLTNGNLDVASAVTFCTSTTGYIAQWYDQMGTGDHLVNATHTAAALPKLIFNTINTTLPAIEAGGSQVLSNTGSYPQQPMTGCACSRLSAGSGSRSDFWAISNSVIQYTGGNNINLLVNGGGPVSIAASDGTFHAFQAVANFGSSMIYSDGTSAGPTAVGGSVGNGNMNLDDFNNGGATCQVTEMIFYSSALSSGQAASMRTSVQGYWATP